MVHLLCVQHEFHARVITARLGSDGIFTEVRPPLGGPYPLPGEVHLYVGEEDVQLARALLSADEDQSRVGPEADPPEAREAALQPLLGTHARLALAILVLTSVLLVALSRAG